MKNIEKRMTIIHFIGKTIGILYGLAVAIAIATVIVLAAWDCKEKIETQPKQESYVDHVMSEISK